MGSVDLSRKEQGYGNDTGASHSSTRRFDEKGAELQKTRDGGNEAGAFGARHL